MAAGGARADENAVKFGRTTAQKAAESQEIETFRVKVDRHSRDSTPEK
ncbi:MAG: DUF4169 family protein [Pseudomonadota bacterium]